MIRSVFIEPFATASMTPISRSGKTLRRYRLGELFSERKEKGHEGLPIMAITFQDGLVPRHELERHIKSNLEPADHLLVRRNDIAYNMMRMWQGVSGLAATDCLISPSYVVVTPDRDKVDPAFASFLFKEPRMIRKFHRYSQGLTNDRLRLYFEHFKDIPVTIPESVAEQRKIGESLSAVETRQIALRNEMHQCAALKSALSQKFLTGWDTDPPPAAASTSPDAG